MVNANIDGVEISLPLPKTFSHGFVGFGTAGFYPAQFDDFRIYKGAKIQNLFVIFAYIYLCFIALWCVFRCFFFFHCLASPDL